VPEVSPDQAIPIHGFTSASLRWIALQDPAKRVGHAPQFKGNIPLTVGGGMASVDDAARALRAGADKIAINSAAVARPELISECAARFGAQCVVVSIDAARVGGRWIVATHGDAT